MKDKAYKERRNNNYVAVFNIIIEEGTDGYLISEVVGIGVKTQAKTHEELIKRTKEAIELYYSVNKKVPQNKFLGLQQLEVEV